MVVIGRLTRTDHGVKHHGLSDTLEFVIAELLQDKRTLDKLCGHGADHRHVGLS